MAIRPAGGGLYVAIEGVGSPAAGGAAGPALLEIGGAAPGMTSGAEGFLCIRPEDVALGSPRSGEGVPAANCFQGGWPQWYRRGR